MFDNKIKYASIFLGKGYCCPYCQQPTPQNDRGKVMLCGMCGNDYMMPPVKPSDKELLIKAKAIRET